MILGMVLMTAAGTAAAQPLKVFVSIPPQAYFVHRIAGDRVDVSVMVRPGANPATYEPKPRQMADLADTRLYFAVGVPFESVWLDRIAAANPAMRVVHTDTGILKHPMPVHRHDGETASDKPEGGGLDPHVWTSPPLVKVLARNIKAALQEADPEHAADYECQHGRFVEDIDALDRELREIFSGAGHGARFMVFHPAWGYFADAYGLEQVPIEVEGKEPKPEALRYLIEEARQEGIKVIFVQPQFSIKSAQVIASAIGGQVVAADPLAEDWLANLREQARKFRDALR